MKFFQRHPIFFSLLPFIMGVHLAWAEATADTVSKSANWAGITGFFLAYLTGLGISFTPCLWPMYPITSSIIFSSSAVKTKKMGLLLSLTYVLGLAAAYTILGALTGKLGEVAAIYLKSAWIVAALTVVLIIFGLSMLGIFELRLPTSLTSKVMKSPRKGFVGVFLMGVIAALIVSPCVSPVVGALIGFVIKSGSWMVGAELFFAFALGMGTILVVIGTLSGALKTLPRPGMWMVRVKQAFGVAMIITAFYLSLPVLISAITTTRESGVPSRSEAKKGIQWMHNLKEGLAFATTSRKPAMIDFTAEWCTYCHQMDRETFPDTRVVAESVRFVAIKFDATLPTPKIRRVLNEYNVVGFPTIIFITANGERKSYAGFIKPEELIAIMREVK
jgi:thiol:disulfide interchange protein DsbD